MNSRKQLLKRIENKNFLLSFIFLMAVGIIMYMMNLYTPLFCDDWEYVYVWGTHIRINSISDILTSQWAHYFEQNGRFLVHCIVQLFDGWIGKGAFNLFNASMFVLFLYGLALNTSNNKQQYFKILSVAFILVFFLMAGFKYTFLWLSGSCNYLWVATAILFFHWLLEKEPGHYQGWSCLLLGLFGFICGWSHEAFVVPICAAYFFYFLTHKKEFKGHRVFMIIGIYLGAALLVFSPASISRFFNHNDADSLGFITRLVNMRNVGLLYLLIAIVSILVISKKLSFKKWIKKEQIFLTSLVVAFVFIFLSGVDLEHSRFGVEFFSLLLILRIIDWNIINNKLISIVNIPVLLFATYVLQVCSKCDAANQQELQQIKGSNSVVSTTQPVDFDYLHRFVLHYMGFESFLEDKQVGESYWINKYYYDYENIQFLPKEFVDGIHSDFHKYDVIRPIGHLPYLAKRLPNQREAESVSLYYDETSYSSVPKSLRKIYRKIFGVPYSGDCAVINVSMEGYNYVIIPNYWPDYIHNLEYITIHLKEPAP